VRRVDAERHEQGVRLGVGRPLGRTGEHDPPIAFATSWNGEAERPEGGGGDRPLAEAERLERDGRRVLRMDAAPPELNAGRDGEPATGAEVPVVVDRSRPSTSPARVVAAAEGALNLTGLCVADTFNVIPEPVVRFGVCGRVGVRAEPPARFLDGWCRSTL
jgi:hypothetical protein